MLVDTMVEQVRQQIDESNEEDITDASILASLNRGQQRLVSIATVKYNPMFMREVDLASSDFADGRSAPMPTQAFGCTINMVEALYNQTSFKILPAEMTQMATWQNNTSSVIPRWYAIQGNRIHLFPGIASSSVIRVRYQVRPPLLVMSQGRITNIDDIATGTLFLDALGSGLSTSVENLSAFINIIDSQTGLVKSTNQIAALDEDAVSLAIKTSSLNRSVVYGEAVSDEISTDVALDDYVTAANGTCVPTLVRDYTDYFIQYAVVEIKRRLGEDTSAEYAALKEHEERVSLMWSGKPAAMRVNRRNPFWSWTNNLINSTRNR